MRMQRLRWEKAARVWQPSRQDSGPRRPQSQGPGGREGVREGGREGGSPHGLLQARPSALAPREPPGAVQTAPPAPAAYLGTHPRRAASPLLSPPTPAWPRRLPATEPSGRKPDGQAGSAGEPDRAEGAPGWAARRGSVGLGGLTPGPALPCPAPPRPRRLPSLFSLPAPWIRAGRK